MFEKCLIVIALALLAGCATVPDVTYKYYRTTWNGAVTVTQTIGCTTGESNRRMIYVQSATVSTNYSRDNTKEPFTLRAKEFGSTWGDSDITVTFTDDGRLRSINQSSTGQGEAIVKSFTGLAGTLSALYEISLMRTEKQSNLNEACRVVDGWGDKKPVSLIYRASLSDKSIGATVDLTPTKDSENLHKELVKNAPGILPTFNVKVEDDGDIPTSATHAENDKSNAMIELQRLARLKLTTSSSSDGQIGSARIVIPKAATYTLPIPKPAIFGKQSFGLSLTEAGAISSLSYGKTSGVGAAFNSANALATLGTPATEAAELKAQADLLAQQQRITLCLSKPDQCK